MSVTGRIDAARAVLLVIDVQEKLIPHIDGHAEIVRRSETLLKSAAEIGVPALLTEHCPESIGLTVPALRAHVPESACIPKRHFSAMDEEAGLPAALKRTGRPQVLIGGTEAHVCVLQTALGVLAAGYETWILTDIAGSRHPEDRLAAFERLRRAGACTASAEMALFEWLRGADHPAFKSIHRRIKAL